MMTTGIRKNIADGMNEREPVIRLGKYALSEKWLFAWILLVGLLVRVWQLGVVPGGINQDEAYSAYEAWSMLHYGTDSFGYANPVYLTAWGSGMNALPSYLMMPFLALFGVHTWVIRLPQMILATVSIAAMYGILKRLFDGKTALFGTFYFAVCPWHIMLARWALESNMAPGFLLLGLYFFLKGVEKPGYYLASAASYGLALYCYATIWPVVPVLLLLQAAYLFWTKRFKLCWQIFAAVGILAVFALPLLLFLLVNNGKIDEIRTAFLSIPKLVYWRGSEVSFANIGENFANMWTMLINQNDNLCWNSTSEWGLYYKGALVFAAVGLAVCARRTVTGIRKREYDPCVFLVIWFLTSVMLGCLISVNVNRINTIHIPIAAFAGIGIYRVCCALKEEFKHAVPIAAGLLAVCLLLFMKFYFTDYKETIAQTFQDGIEESVDYAEELAGDDGIIYVTSSVTYSKILFLGEQPTDEYIETVQYTNYPSAYMNISSCGRFRFGIGSVEEDGVYILTANEASAYEGQGYAITYFDTMAVVQK